MESDLWPVDLTCPRCGAEIKAFEYEDGKCPVCGNRYTWDYMVAEDYSDEWSFAVFESDYINSPMFKWYFGDDKE